MKKFILLVVMTLLLIHQDFSQRKNDDTKFKIAAKYKKAVAESRNLVSDLMAKQSIPGLSIAVAVNGNLVWSEAFGFADLENKVPATAQTRFRIGSLSKLFTAAAVAKLYEQGLLDLDAPIQKYVPAFPKKDFEITARELVGHLAGIRHYKRDDYINQRRFETVTESLKNFQDDALLHQPHSKYFYSSFGFVLLSAAVEGASKQNFPTFMQTQVFDPLGLKNTLADDNKKIIENRTGFYSKNSEGQITNEIYMDTSDRLAAGGFLSTSEDLALFGSATLNDSFFKPETRSLIFTSQKTTDGKETGVGFGWRIGKDGKGRTIYHHGGDTIGGRAFLLVYPESKIVVALACNLSFAKFAEAETEKFAELFMN